MEYFLYKDDKEMGPFTEEELRAMVKAGSIARDEFAWREGMAEWLPLNKIIPLKTGGIGAHSPARESNRPGQETRSSTKSKSDMLEYVVFGVIIVVVSACVLYIYFQKNDAQPRTDGSAHVESKPFKPEVYRSSDGKVSLALKSPGECELSGKGKFYLCKYTRQGDSLRVVTTTLAKNQIVDFHFVANGIQDTDGMVLLSPEAYNALQGSGTR